MAKRKKITKRVVINSKPKISIAPWVSVLFTFVAIGLVPWIIYLSYSLPTRHINPNWDVTWVVLDIALMLTILMTGLLAALKSRWIIVSVTTMSSFLLVDAWFDIQSSHGGRELAESILLAIFLEIPFSILGYLIAYRTINRNIE